eukprot:TRINITY_DN3225_c0_g1_i1.p1 TRINITY_DN3225_c0_g1~~TRINITY_DN3225_c0_g1_i1.p1  ORF type:complete len:413 (+),score=114.82 TRINITY_DN3225_c0_g1_i1:46-1239(+)
MRLPFPKRTAAFFAVAVFAAAGIAHSHRGEGPWVQPDTYVAVAAAAAAVAVGGEVRSHEVAMTYVSQPPVVASAEAREVAEREVAEPVRERSASAGDSADVDGRVLAARRMRGEGVSQVWRPPASGTLGSPGRCSLAWKYDSRRRGHANIPRRGTYPIFDHREGLGILLEKWGTGPITGVEIGVRWGEFSTALLKKVANLTLYMVDPWTSQENYTDLVNIKSRVRGNELLSGDDMYEYVAQKMTRAFGHRARVLRMFGGDAAARFANRSVDFLYIDARHDYKAVTEDLEAWWPKLRPGGVMSGHDFFYGNDSCVTGTDQDWTLQSDGSRDWRGVRGAVEGFTQRYASAVAPLATAGYKVGRIITTQWLPDRLPKRGRKRRCVPFPSWLFIRHRMRHP